MGYKFRKCATLTMSILTKPITDLINLSISQSSVPDNFKVAKLKPLFKKGSKLDPRNYRPISLLPLISKIYEKVIRDQTLSFLNENKLLHQYQSGFRKFHSTDTCLTYLNDKILKGIDSNLMTGLILIDLQKAFDTIDHEILLKKLVHLGFSKESIKLFRSYLCNRTFLVDVENHLSVPGNLECGVPQGSVLGPLLFLLYINDMAGVVDCEILLYADDTCLVFQDHDLKTISDNLNTNFNKLCDWFLDNKLSIHLGKDKTKAIVFSGKNRPKDDKLNIYRGDIKIAQHKEVNYLGCWFDERATSEQMVLKVIDKINSRLKFLWRKHKFLSPPLRRILCNAIIQPHFDYAVAAWYPNLKKNT